MSTLPNLCLTGKLDSVMDLKGRGGTPGARLPYGPKVSQLHGVFRKIWQHRMLVPSSPPPPRRVGASSYTETAGSAPAINLSVLCFCRDFLMAKIRETYGATYHAVMHHDESYTAGRPSKRVSGLYHTLKHKGAQFGIRAGERYIYDYIINVME